MTETALESLNDRNTELFLDSFKVVKKPVIHDCAASSNTVGQTNQPIPNRVDLNGHCNITGDSSAALSIAATVVQR